jgi:hypothetical protein
VKIAFDMDSTLIYGDSPEHTFISPISGERESLCDTPRYDVIAIFHAYEAMGFEMFIWSGSGVDYAKVKSARLGLQATVVEKGSFRPDIAVDDQDVNLGITNIRV